MIILCVDGIDPDLVNTYKWDSLFEYNCKLEIPKECYVLAGDEEDPHRLQAHTTRVWATIFSGKIIDYGLIKREGLRKKAHDFLVRHNITWRKAKRYKVAPVNENLDTIFNHYRSFAWNIPTINPEWIATFPNYEAFEKYCKRELMMWFLMTWGASYYPENIQAYYVRYLDYVGHNHPDRLMNAYNQIFDHVRDLKQKADVILLSDHGCEKGWHTDWAYLGSDYPNNCVNISELRGWFEALFKEKGIKKK